MSTFITIIILVAILIILTLLAVGLYNKLVMFKNEYKNAFAQIDVQLTRRYELIPNLVEVAKKYMVHESQTLEAVIAARNGARQALDAVKQSPEDASALQSLANSETLLGNKMGGFMALFESYPDLKANQNMMQLTEELSSTENKVSFARQYFNDRVTEYNNQTEIFPSNIIANLFSFKQAKLLEIDNIVDIRKPMKISFE